MDLRGNYTDVVIELMRKSVNGSPINPPIWWIDPTDADAYAIDDGKERIAVFKKSC